MKLFSIKVKELFEPIDLQRKGDGFALFKNFSWEKDLWVTLGDFVLTTILHLAKIDQLETNFAVLKIITVIWVLCVQKTQKIFPEIASNFTF